MTPSDIAAAAQEVMDSIEGQIDTTSSDSREVRVRLHQLAMCVKALAEQSEVTVTYQAAPNLDPAFDEQLRDMIRRRGGGGSDSVQRALG